MGLKNLNKVERRALGLSMCAALAASFALPGTAFAADHSNLANLLHPNSGQSKSATVGDFAWFDENGNGLQDEGENPAEGIKVDLLDASNNLVASTQTDAAGKYAFRDLQPNTYALRFHTKDGWMMTRAHATMDHDKDSDASPRGLTPQFELHAGDKLGGMNAGLIKTDAKGAGHHKQQNAGGSGPDATAQGAGGEQLQQAEDCGDCPWDDGGFNDGGFDDSPIGQQPIDEPINDDCPWDNGQPLPGDDQQPITQPIDDQQPCPPGDDCPWDDQQPGQPGQPCPPGEDCPWEGQQPGQPGDDCPWEGQQPGQPGHPGQPGQPGDDQPCPPAPGDDRPCPPGDDCPRDDETSEETPTSESSSPSTEPSKSPEESSTSTPSSTSESPIPPMPGVPEHPGVPLKPHPSESPAPETSESPAPKTSEAPAPSETPGSSEVTTQPSSDRTDAAAPAPVVDQTPTPHPQPGQPTAPRTAPIPTEQAGYPGDQGDRLPMTGGDAVIRALILTLIVSVAGGSLLAIRRLRED